MKRFVIRCAGFVALQAVLMALVLRMGAPDVDESYVAAFWDKEHLLEAVAGPRVILAGGSNVAFGSDARLLADSLGMPVVNAGLHAGLGLPVMLAQLHRHIAPGDVVVISAQYQLLNGAGAEEVILAELVSSNPTALRYLDAPDLKAFLDGAFQRLGSRTANAFRAGRWTMPWDERMPRQGIVQRSGFDGSGDFVAHHGEPSLPPDRIAPAPLVYSGDGARRAMELLSGFARRAEARDVRVFLEFPPYPRPLFDAKRADIASLEALVGEARGLHALNRPGDLAWGWESFFDTEYHLTGPATRRRTLALFQALRRAGVGE